MSNSLFLGTVNAQLVSQTENIAVNINDCSGNAIQADVSGNLKVSVSNQPALAFDGSGNLECAIQNLNLDVNKNIGVIVNNDNATTIFVKDSSVETNTANVSSALLNQRQSVLAWDESAVEQNGVSEYINPAGSSYTNTALSVYGNTSGSCTLCVQFANDTSTFYSSQYTYTVNGNFGFCIAGCSACSVRLIMTSATTTTITAFLNTC